jgi:hypothetical protein
MSEAVKFNGLPNAIPVQTILQATLKKPLMAVLWGLF